jgi:ABC-type multidrug transport system fused ATPase/permease subunit
MKAKTPTYGAFISGLLTYKLPLTLADFLFNILIFGHGTALSFFARQILNRLDAGSKGQALGEVAWCLAAILLVSLLRVVAIMGCAAMDSAREYYYRHRTRLGLFRRIFLRRDMTAVAGSSGRVFEVLDDDVPAVTFPVELLTEAGGYCVCTLITLAILFSIDWKVTLMAFLPLSMAVYGVQKLSGRMKERRRSSRQAHDSISAFLSDVAGSVLSIKTAGLEGSILHAFDKKNAGRRKAVLQDTAFNAKMGAVLSASIQVGTAILMCVFAWMMTGGSFKAGDFGIFVTSLFVLADCVNRIVEVFAEYRKGEVSFERILEAAQGDGELPTDTGLTLSRPDTYAPQSESLPEAKEFTVSGLTYAYDTGDGVRDVNFTLRPGELTVVAGGVGSGKSTLIQLLAGTMAPKSGSVTYGGMKALFHLPYIALAPQGPRFLSTDIGENLRMGREMGEEALFAALSRAELDGAVQTMKDGLQTSLGNRGATISGGQRQRLNLARMYAHNAVVNLIDDNVSALDEGTKARVLHNLLSYVKSEGRTVLIATNDPLFLKAADTVLVMRNGRIQAQGRYDDLAASNEYLRSVTA